MKTLIVYYSHTGHTRRVAEQLAAALKGTLCPITETRPREGSGGYMRCVIDALLRRDADIVPSAHDPAAYDLVLLGTPIWVWRLASPVRTFVRRHGAQIRRCAFFCTMGGAGADKAFAELEQLVGQTPLATLALTEAQLADDASLATAGRIEHFAEHLREPMGAQALAA